MKDIKGKAQLDLIPYNALEAVAEVREFGKNKYGDAWQWQGEVDPKYFATAGLRHIYKALQVEDNDDESGLLHLAHAATTLLMALENKIIQNNKKALERGKKTNFPLDKKKKI